MLLSLSLPTIRKISALATVVVTAGAVAVALLPVFGDGVEPFTPSSPDCDQQIATARSEPDVVTVYVPLSGEPETTFRATANVAVESVTVSVINLENPAGNVNDWLPSQTMAIYTASPTLCDGTGTGWLVTLLVSASVV